MKMKKKGRKYMRQNAKEKSKSIKEEQGITLIALVVTIIILLILAGVAINMALGDNGLFRRSKEAVNTWKSAEENETAVLDYIDSFLEDNANNNTEETKYEIILDNSEGGYLLKDKEEQAMVTFEKVYVIYNGTKYDVSKGIMNYGYLVGEHKGTSFSGIYDAAIYHCLKEYIENLPNSDKCTLIIIKDGKQHTTEARFSAAT